MIDTTYTDPAYVRAKSHSKVNWLNTVIYDRYTDPAYVRAKKPFSRKSREALQRLFFAWGYKLIKVPNL